MFLLIFVFLWPFFSFFKRENCILCVYVFGDQKTESMHVIKANYKRLHIILLISVSFLFLQKECKTDDKRDTRLYGGPLTPDDMKDYDRGFVVPGPDFKFKPRRSNTIITMENYNYSAGLYTVCKKINTYLYVFFFTF